jgi:hypothetical protein
MILTIAGIVSTVINSSHLKLSFNRGEVIAIWQMTDRHADDDRC